MGDNMVKPTAVGINPETLTKLKIYALHHKKTATEVVTEIVEAYLKKNFKLEINGQEKEDVENGGEPELPPGPRLNETLREKSEFHISDFVTPKTD